MSVDDVMGLADLALRLGQERRATLHPDGIRSETVATHTVMLAMIACAVASEHPDRFDLGLVAQFAVVHDIPEVAPGGPGDIDTFLTTDGQALARKDAAESEACARLVKSHPRWLGPLVARYQAQHETEARLVRYLDKVLPKATLALSGCAQFKRDGTTVAYFRDFVFCQERALSDQYPELADLVGPLYRAMNKAVIQSWAAAEQEGGQMGIKPTSRTLAQALRLLNATATLGFILALWFVAVGWFVRHC